MESVKTTYGECRCCLAKGKHRDIMKEYTNNGIREIYIDTFVECFNLFLTTDSNISPLICTKCVQRLRDATSFRSLVVATEKTLIDALDNKNMLFMNVGEQIQQSDLDIKMEPINEIKIEDRSDSDIEVDYDIDCNGIDNESSEGDTNNRAIDEAALLARFEGQTLKLPTRHSLYAICPQFVKHLDNFHGKVIPASMLADMLESSRPNKVYITEKLAQINNAAVLLENSNMAPFKGKSRTGFPCFYCRSVHENVVKLREHQLEHRKSDAKGILSTYGAECLVVYADITDLACTVCNKAVPNINELKSHLIKEHKKIYYQDFTDRLIPYKLSPNNIYECQICGFNFETFGSIERHMNVHFRNYVCKECGTGFVTKYRLKVHVKSMHIDGNFPCDVCNKVFTTQQKHKNHVDTVHKLVKRFKCPKCPERFSEYFRRQKHMVTAHGVAPLQYKCNVCDKSFDRRYTLSRHLKRDHLEERDFQCELCSYKCFTNNELRVHMVKHNGERIFECSVCKKSYARKKTLKEHMRIHNNDKRFACSVCGQAFVQKCSLKGHLKTHHLEFAMQ